MTLVVKNPPTNAGNIIDIGWIPGPGRSSGRGHGNPLQYSCLENLMNRGTRWATAHRVARRSTQLKWLSKQAYFIEAKILSSTYHSIPLSVYFVETKVKVLVVQLCPTICDTMGCSPPGSSVYRILQARILEWVAIPLFSGSSHPRDQTWVSCIVDSSPFEPPGKPSCS